MIFRTLYSQLALTLFTLLILVGLILIQIVSHSSALYQQEASQKLNTKLAEHIVAEQSLMEDQQVNHQVLDVLFHDLMVTNPSIELYVLDKQGAVVGFSAAEGKVKRTQVGLDPVLKFLDGDVRFPLKGDDPRDLTGKKVFSTTKIINNNSLQGYLYIVLAGEQYDNVVEMLGNSFILDSALKVLLVALAAAMLIGLIVFAVQTRRFRVLSNVMHNYAADTENSTIHYPYKVNSKNEIDLLGRQFNQMAEKIDTQIHELKEMDNFRREMVANVSHDLRTPLTTMRGYLETLQLKKAELSEQEREQYLETALSHSQYLGELVEELFELARLDSCDSVVNSEIFSMGELVQDITQKYQLHAQQKSIKLEADLNPEVPLIVGDIAMMQRVLENLLENGLRYTPEGGRISISVDIDSDSGKVMVQVSDSGCGIPAEETSKIFERFYRQNSNRSDSENAGLGLAIVKRILELHGSVINVQSEVNQGTVFSFHLNTEMMV